MPSEIMEELRRSVDKFVSEGPVKVSNPGIMYKAIKNTANMNYREYLNSYKDIVKCYRSSIVIIPQTGYYTDLLNTIMNYDMSRNMGRINTMTAAIMRMKSNATDVDFI